MLGRNTVVHLISFMHINTGNMSAIANPQIGLYGRVVKSPASGAGLRKAGVGSNPTAVSSNFYTIFDFPALPYYSNTNVLNRMLCIYGGH